MGQRKFTCSDNMVLEKCPKCGNNTSFIAHSSQVAEDYCEIWIVCVCGYDPTADQTGYRLEDVLGCIGKPEIEEALECSWNDPIAESASKQML